MQNLSIATYVCGARFGTGHEQLLQTIYINSTVVATKVSASIFLICLIDFPFHVQNTFMPNVSLAVTGTSKMGLNSKGSEKFEPI